MTSNAIFEPVVYNQNVGYIAPTVTTTTTTITTHGGNTVITIPANQITPGVPYQVLPNYGLSINHKFKIGDTVLIRAQIDFPNGDVCLAIVKKTYQAFWHPSAYSWPSTPLTPTPLTPPQPAIQNGNINYALQNFYDLDLISEDHHYPFATVAVSEDRILRVVNGLDVMLELIR